MRWRDRRKQREQLKSVIKHHEGTLQLLKARKERLLLAGKEKAAAEQDQKISWQTKQLEKARHELQEFERKEE
jgi:uncharacterized protein YciI